MQKVIIAFILFIFFNFKSFSQNNFDIRFDLDTVNLATKVACYDVQLRASTTAFGLAGQNYRIFYDASKATYLSGSSTLPNAYSVFNLVQNIVVNASNTGSIPFESTLGFLNFGMDLNDVALGGISLSTTTWTTTANLCFDVALEPIGDPNTCLDIIWARDGLTNEYASAFVEVSEWVGPNNTTSTVGLGYDDLNFEDGYIACFNVPAPDTEDTIPLCTDGIDNDSDGLIDCLDPDCVAIPTLDCDDDGVPNGEDCAPTDPLVYPGAMCNDNDANTINDVFNTLCQCVGTPIIPGEYEIRFSFKDYDCNTNNFTYFVQLRSISGSPINLSGQNYRLYFNGALMTYVSGISVLPANLYSPFTLVQNIVNQDASATNGPLFFEENLSFINYFMDLDDNNVGGIILPADSTWITTSELTFNSTNSLTGSSIPFIDIVWARDSLTNDYATSFVEVAKWLGVGNVVAATPNIYGDVLQTDSTNIGFITDCDGDDVPNDDDCAPTDPLVFPGAICDDNNPNTINDRFDSMCVCIGTPIQQGFGSINGLAWHDFNGNGTRDLADVGLPGVMVRLFTAAGVPVSSVFTTITGAYSFSNLPSDTYYVVFDKPSDFQYTFANRGSDLTDSDVTGANGIGTTDNIVITENQIVSNVDAGYFLCAKIGDNVWYDINKNDIYESFENGINGIRVNLWRNHFGVWLIWDFKFTGPKFGSASLDGYFEFCAPPGQYFIEVIMPPLGLVPALPDKGNNEQNDSDLNNANGFGTTSSFTVTSGQIKDDLGAGYYPMATVGNLVWLDENINGFQEPSEPIVPGVLVEAFDAVSNEKLGQSITNQDGIYEIDYLQKKEVFLKFSPPIGYIATVARSADDTIDSDVDHDNGPFTTRTFETLPANNNQHIDFGIAFGVLPLVWLDVNAEDAGNKHIVSWKTHSELNVSHFIVERRMGGMLDFEEITDLILAKGKTNDVQSYEMIDDNVMQSGLYIYRIRQVDFNGKIDYSPYVFLKRNYQNTIEIFPNPVNDILGIKLTIQQEEIVQLKIFDSTNKIVKVVCENTLLQGGVSNLNFNVEDIPNGHYTLSFTIDGVNTNKNIIVIKN